MYTYFYVKTTFYFGHDGNLLCQENFYFYFNLIALLVYTFVAVSILSVVQI